jgi:hypothetical protein
MFITQLSNANESTYLNEVVVLISDLINQANKCNIILTTIQLNHFNEMTWLQPIIKSCNRLSKPH